MQAEYHRKNYKQIGSLIGEIITDENSKLTIKQQQIIIHHFTTFFMDDNDLFRPEQFRKHIKNHISMFDRE